MMIIFSLVLIVFSILFFSADTVKNSFLTSQDQRLARLAVDDISTTAHRVYVQGNGAEQTVQIRFPRSTNKIEIANNTVELYLYGDDFPSSIRLIPFNVSGNISAQNGLAVITVQSIGQEVVFS